MTLSSSAGSDRGRPGRWDSTALSSRAAWKGTLSWPDGAEDLGEGSCDLGATDRSLSSSVCGSWFGSFRDGDLHQVLRCSRDASDVWVGKCVIWREMGEMKEKWEERHVGNVETKAWGMRSAGDVECNVSLVDLHPDGASVRGFSWPCPCLFGSSVCCWHAQSLHWTINTGWG